MSDAGSATKLSPKSVVEEARKLAGQVSSKDKEETAQNAKYIELTKTNAFAQLMLNSSLSHEAKRDEMAKLLTFDKAASKEENRAKLQAFQEFMEYLQEQRKVLNREGIKLQDTEAFAELQSVLDEMTKASIEFQEKIKPLLEVLNAVFEIRKQDKITDVYKEIQSDKEWLEEKQNALKELEEELRSNKITVAKLEAEKARLSQDKWLFGAGPIKGKAKARIAEIEEVELKEVSARIDELVSRVEGQQKIIAAGRDSENPGLAAQKAVLKEFLDLSKDDNRQRQKDLIDAAVNYVDTSDSRLKNVLGTLERLGKHAEVMSDANGMLRGMHLIMDESLKQVTKQNAAVKSELSQVPAEESPIARLTREEKLTEVNEHITSIDDGAVDIANSVGGLTKHSVQIQAYKDTLRNESSSTKRLHLEGVSQMGEQLMSVISAISAAATSESRSLAANNFAKMAEQNQTIISQEVVRNATNIEIEARQISKLVGELQDYGDVLNASSEIASRGYGKMRETVDAIRKVSGSVQDAIKDFVADRAEVGIASGEGGSNGANDAKTVTKDAAVTNPFEKLQQR